MKGTTYFKIDYGFSVNEGEGPINFTMLFPWSKFGFYFYLYIFGKRFHT